MSRQSGWSSTAPAATAANAVPVGGGSATATSTNAAAAGGDSVLSVADKLRQAADLGNVLVPLDAASKHARKIYIGNLPPSATSEQVITQFFNQTLAVLLPNKPPGDSIIGTYLNVQKRFAFIENRSIEETTFTLSLDGIQMDEYALKLRRPQDYNPQLATQQLSAEMRLKGGISSLRGAWNPMQQSAESQGQATSNPGIISTSVEDGPHKVFIGGLPHHMAEQDVKELLSAYGPLKAFHLVKDRELDRSKGFAFCEWRDPAVTDVACQSLNGMKVGDRFLNVRRAVPHSTHRGSGGASITTDQMPTLALPYLPPIDTKPLPPIQKGIPPLELPPIAKYLMAETAQSSRCLAVRNVVPSEPEVPVEVDRVQKIMDEVKNRAASLGRVRSGIFHHSEGGRILVEFSTPEEAADAQKIFRHSKVQGKEIECGLAEMIPELRKACLNRILAEASMLSRLDLNGRNLYNEAQKSTSSEKKIRREKILKEIDQEEAAQQQQQQSTPPVADTAPAKSDPGADSKSSAPLKVEETGADTMCDGDNNDQHPPTSEGDGRSGSKGTAPTPVGDERGPPAGD